jgi:S1-C subfamily serine protease
MTKLVDTILILIFLSALVRGRELGLMREVLSDASFIGGLFLGATLQPYVLHLAHSESARMVLGFGFVLGCALLCLTVSELIGAILKTHLVRFKVNKVDAVFGAIGGGITFIIIIWLLAPVLISLPYPRLQQDVRGSFIVAKIDRSLPKAPNIVAELGHVIYPNGFPQVFTGIEPSLPASTPLPDLGPLTAAVQKDQISVVKVEGRGCGGIVEGSGFVAGNGLVATNAHVLAGVANPVVLDKNGEHTATPVWFDTDLDFAVLHVNNLAGTPLTITGSKTANGTTTAILGYPGGGGFAAGPAAILDDFTAIGRNIYGSGQTSRDVYAVKGSIIPGNSGGPLINSNGTVVGVIFAASTTYNEVGYALTAPQVLADLHQAETTNKAVSTANQCAQ